jgi:hypothetical protein
MTTVPTGFVSIGFVAGIFGLAFLASGCEAKDAGAAVYTLCGSGVSEAAAAEARKAFPDLPTAAVDRGPRNGFLYRNERHFFDGNGDGFIDFEEFADEEWATFLAYLPEGRCTVTKDQYLAVFLGEKSDPSNNVLYSDDANVKGFERQFDRLDRTKKGYLVRDDFLPLWRAEFEAGDANGDGKLDSKEHP